MEMEVVVKPEACQEARKEAIKRIRQRISVPGFRKGKAPLAMIEKNYAKAIDENWHEGIGNFALREALGLTEIYPWSGEGVPPPEVEHLSL